MLAERIQAWTQEGFQQGIEQGERQMCIRLTYVRFGAEVAERLPFCWPICTSLINWCKSANGLFNVRPVLT